MNDNFLQGYIFVEITKKKWGTKMNKKIFLGGPIQYAYSHNGDFDYRIRSNLEYLNTILQKNDFEVFSAHSIEKFGKETHVFKSFDIFERDYTWMKECNLYVAFLPIDLNGKLVRTDGTYMELGWAYILKKPILILCDLSRIMQSSLLLQGLIEKEDIKVLEIERIIEQNDVLINEIKLLLGVEEN